MKFVDVFLRDFRQFLNKLCETYDKVWVVRLRKFNTKLMLSAIFAQILNKDATNYRLIFNHLEMALGLPSIEFSASSFSKARRRFPAEFFVDVSQWIVSYFKISSADRWFGYSIFAIDSSKIDLPKELEGELEEDGPQDFDSMNDCDSYYPKGMYTVVYDLQRAMIYDSVFSQHADERLNACLLLDGLPNMSLLIADQGFPSFELLYQAQKKKIKVLFRIPKTQAPEELLEFAESDSRDEIIHITPSIPSERKSLKQGLCPTPLEVRAVKYEVGTTDFLVITTLLDEEISSTDIANLYHARWDIEEAFKLTKCGLKLENFKSKHIDGVLQELWASQVISVLSSAISMACSGSRTKIPGRVEPSKLGIIKILRCSLLKVIVGCEKFLDFTIESICRGLEKTKTRVRGNRSYDRGAKIGLTPWSLYAEGVSC
jgi:Transposase DDE domain